MSTAEGYTISEVSRASGVARMTLYRALKDGRLNSYVIGDGRGPVRLKAAVMDFIRGGGIRPRVDSPWLDTKTELRPPLVEEKKGGELPVTLIADWANGLLEPSLWGPPPWPAHRWSTLLITWDEAEVLARQHGAFSQELLDQLAEEGE